MATNNSSDQPIETLEDRCSLELPKMYDVVTRLMAGEKTVRMRTSDYREVEYHDSNLDSALSLYNYWYKLCGADSTYPDLAAAQTDGLTRRGPPAPFGRC